MQLKAYYDEKKPRKIIYNNSNNLILTESGRTRDAPTSNPQTVSYYDCMIISLVPDIIAFKAGKDVICFNGVVDVKLKQDVVWDIVYIRCYDTPTVYAILFEY